MSASPSASGQGRGCSREPQTGQGSPGRSSRARKPAWASRKAWRSRSYCSWAARYRSRIWPYSSCAAFTAVSCADNAFCCRSASRTSASLSRISRSRFRHWTSRASAPSSASDCLLHSRSWPSRCSWSSRAWPRAFSFCAWSFWFLCTSAFACSSLSRVSRARCTRCSVWLQAASCRSRCSRAAASCSAACRAWSRSPGRASCSRCSFSRVSASAWAASRYRRYTASTCQALWMQAASLSLSRISGSSAAQAASVCSACSSWTNSFSRFRAPARAFRLASRRAPAS